MSDQRCAKCGGEEDHPVHENRTRPNYHRFDTGEAPKCGHCEKAAATDKCINRCDVCRHCWADMEGNFKSCPVERARHPKPPTPEAPTEMGESGVERIAAERARQVSEEGWTPENDDDHAGGEMAMAAVCYAAPEHVYRLENRYVNQQVYSDPFPWRWDKRYAYGSCRDNPGNALPDPSTYMPAERLDLLVKAGALIAAEIDRLLRVKP